MDAVHITGTTRLYAVLGDPVRQVRAPALLNPVFARLGRDAVLVPVQIPAEQLPELIRALTAVRNLDGLLVTVPHKQACRRLADSVTDAAALSGSVNALRRRPDGGWEGANFDGEGFVRALRAAGHEPRGTTVCLAGAGGAGSAIAVSLLRAGAHLTLWDADADRADALAARLAPHFPDRITAAPGHVDADLAVNATPMGLRPEDPLPFDPAALKPGTTVADIIMKPRETALLRTAARAGLPVLYGEPMLAEQIALYEEFFQLD
ncbi:shikimate dehydrogenase family protein [Streptomyces sp. WSLK1-5]|uniref:shikimate dehydrogenase family protein n=1 Tax=unclassified Streptomyces TaxID=2593676 RepID=UPI000F645DF7|nr:shikimate dehydrogenase [Streptomyces sp. RP5T]RRR83933.1 shikimate dehydrogenase [Streptomyces sp. RP5T]